MGGVEEVNSLHGAETLTRRGFIQAGIGCGFATAAAPILAQQAIKTSVTGLVAGSVEFSSGKDLIPAYRARPASGTRHPVVVVVSEIFGVHEYIQDVCRRLAQQGYYAIAPAFFVRQGDVNAYTSTAELIQKVIAKTPDAQVLSDIDASLKWAGQEGADLSRLAITGFCWGGRIVWLYAAHNPALKAGVAWYGRLVSGFDPTLQPLQPVDVATRLYAPVLGLYGGNDAGIPLDTVERMKNLLATGTPASRTSEFVVFPEAPHAFHADYRASYRKEAAEEAWIRLMAWLERHGI
ncbi:MAG: dienelactone hydrolase family protein [Burkholderiales bacterium]|jgi:carboxymethylenebutenolidase|nr:dienelactone hydrolase family protein [Burkholderiales bacterium]MCA3161855.1 dienelactone hydrolase family protein [Burkholderiales bacterium]MCA3163287.1 dienelactone hydrolase family protein [Burkholderiales bacterium]MCA3166703.1 dienelactone hydrolase family protein [Burkholderiales bacterium]MCA3170211.1 dienelactone hydrolase family protein [Burkholderiales bacterium]